MHKKWGHDQFSLSSTYMGSALAVPIWKSSKLTLIDGDWPHDILDKVAHFPRIKTLCLEIRPSGYECVKPYLSYYTSIQLYKYIDSQRTSSPLTELVTLDDHHCSGLYDVATYKAVSCRWFKDAGLLDVWSSQIAGYRTDSTESFYGPVGNSARHKSNGLIQCGPRIVAYSGDGFSSAGGVQLLEGTRTAMPSGCPRPEPRAGVTAGFDH
ncbi:uncharacterized protein EI90DRAFT_3049291 [Cantharellus anzutake]|uniref:uncharacterized protein n=1 Tax=Cantharellus anzutake TaxID=1750568 RepID=UPI001905E6B5|nr:uncharacterized protein EI90DRAFT_3049291 [Cantharellus anzutake]KAF8335046.1 hypothetical protein EI90DRAFT_3049291 [Cantharellus anzutake]